MKSLAESVERISKDHSVNSTRRLTSEFVLRQCKDSTASDPYQTTERRRLDLQKDLDRQKTTVERNRSGLNLYPKPALRNALRRDGALALQLLDLLNRIDPQTLVSCGRTYGGNLHKLEPNELANVPLHDLPQTLRRAQPVQNSLSLE